MPEEHNISRLVSAEVLSQLFFLSLFSEAGVTETSFFIFMFLFSSPELKAQS